MKSPDAGRRRSLVSKLLQLTGMAGVSPFLTAQKSIAPDPDELFGDLDGRELLVAGRSWRIEVFSVGDFDNGRWVQLGLSSDESYMLTLHCAPFEAADRLMAAVRSWLDSPSENNQILNVA